MLTDDDLLYVRREFVALDELCAGAGRDLEDVRRRIGARELPSAPYPGLEFVPADYFDLPDAAGFAATYDGPDPAENLEAYLDGTYFVCLRRATPANIVRKEQLVTRVRALVAEPRLADERWQTAMRGAVGELDRLERPFSPDYDRVRFGVPPTRDELIATPRRRWPELFAVAAAVAGSAVGKGSDPGLIPV